MTPNVAGNLEVSADQRNLVLRSSRVNKRERVSTGRTFQVFPLDNGYLGARGRLKHGSIFEFVALPCRNRGLSMGASSRHYGGSE